MKRRNFITTAVATGAGLATLSMPAAAQDLPKVSWRMSTGWPKSLDTIFGSAEELCKRVAELTGGPLKYAPSQVVS